MFEWLSENYMTVIIIAVIAAVLAWDIVYLIKKRKKGGLCSGCGNCSGCSGCKSTKNNK